MGQWTHHSDDGANDEVIIECESGDVITIMKDEINAAVGKLSPIGYYTEEVYYEN